MMDKQQKEALAGYASRKGKAALAIVAGVALSFMVRLTPLIQSLPVNLVSWFFVDNAFLLLAIALLLGIASVLDKARYLQQLEKEKHHGY